MKKKIIDFFKGIFNKKTFEYPIYSEIKKNPEIDDLYNIKPDINYILNAKIEDDIKKQILFSFNNLYTLYYKSYHHNKINQLRNESSAEYVGELIKYNEKKSENLKVIQNELEQDIDFYYHLNKQNKVKYLDWLEEKNSNTALYIFLFSIFNIIEILIVIYTIKQLHFY